MQRISINGVTSEHLSIMDRGLQYGDGLFETIACVDGALQFWDEHIRRMKAGADMLGITFPGEEKYFQDINNLLDHSSDKKFVIKLLLTRGPGERGYRQPRSPEPTRAVIITAWPEYPKQHVKKGINVCLCKHPISLNPAIAGIKHLNRLDNVLARSEWDDEFDEGFMVDIYGSLIEGTVSNIFGVKNKTLFTPSLDQCGVMGVIRDQVLSIAKENGINIHVENITVENIKAMEEIFITNSIIGIWPVCGIGEARYSIGEMTRDFEKELNRRMKDSEKACT